VKGTRGKLRGGWSSPETSVPASDRGGATLLDLLSLAASRVRRKRGIREVDTGIK
jgi:hypothetical protein